MSEQQVEVIGSDQVTPGQAVEIALRRLKTVWRRHEWTPDLLREYRRVLSRIGDPVLIEATMDAVIDATEVAYPPTPGAVVAAGREAAASVERPRQERAKPRWVGPEHNRCPECEEAGTSSQVVIDANGIASCAEGGHRMTWRVG